MLSHLHQPLIAQLVLFLMTVTMPSAQRKVYPVNLSQFGRHYAQNVSYYSRAQAGYVLCYFKVP